jgi:hypothetical protein
MWPRLQKEPDWRGKPVIETNRASESPECATTGITSCALICAHPWGYLPDGNASHRFHRLSIDGGN